MTPMQTVTAIVFVVIAIAIVVDVWMRNRRKTTTIDLVLEPRTVNKVFAINDMLAMRSYHLEKVEAHMRDMHLQAEQWVAMHGEADGSDEADELLTFWFDLREDYETTINRINRLRTCATERTNDERTDESRGRGV